MGSDMGEQKGVKKAKRRSGYCSKWTRKSDGLVSKARFMRLCFYTAILILRPERGSVSRSSRECNSRLNVFSDTMSPRAASRRPALRKKRIAGFHTANLSGMLMR
jgi:hypothetical protein